MGCEYGSTEDHMIHLEGWTVLLTEESSVHLKSLPGPCVGIPLPATGNALPQSGQR